MGTRWTSKHTGQKIDDTIDCVCNPNLLDNWYFGNPVNQRGQTEYTSSGYTVDRWKLEANGTVKSASVVSSGIALNNGDDTTYCNFAQIVEKLPAGTYIVSFLVDDFSNVNQVFCSANNKSSFIFNSNVVSLKFTLDADSDSVKIGIQRKLSGNVLTIKAAKLELGSQQTLAHQDADGNWVLNEIPDYGEQLRRCQYYSRFFGYDIEIPCSNNPDGKHIEGTLPLTMRSGNGSISYSEGFLFFGDRSFYAVSGANVHSNGGRVKIGANVSGQLQSNIQATLYLRNCSILFDL